MNLAQTLGLPYPRYVGHLLRAGALAWIALRVTYVVVLMVGVLFFNILPLSDGIEVALRPTVSTRIIMLLGAPAVVWWARKRAHAQLLHSNLGASPFWFWIFPGSSALVAYLVTQGVLEHVERLM